jgi:hypothetical protein
VEVTHKPVLWIYISETIVMNTILAMVLTALASGCSGQKPSVSAPKPIVRDPGVNSVINTKFDASVPGQVTVLGSFLKANTEKHLVRFQLLVFDSKKNIVKTVDSKPVQAFPDGQKVLMVFNETIPMPAGTYDFQLQVVDHKRHVLAWDAKKNRSPITALAGEGRIVKVK